MNTDVLRPWGFVLSLALLLWSPGAAAQPCFIADDDGVSDGGWFGANSRFRCTSCTDCAGFLVEVRLASGSYGDADSAQLTAAPWSYAPVGPAAVYRHLAAYAWRVTAVFADGGTGPPSAEQPATADVVAPTPPGVPVQSELDGGSFRLTFPPATDDGAGVYYRPEYVLRDAGRDSTFGSARIGVADLREDLGPGEWEVAVTSRDLVGNWGGTVAAAATVVVVGDPGVPPPAAPTLSGTTFSSAFALTVREPADAYHFLGVEADGGSFALPSYRYVPVGPAPFVVWAWLSRECVFRVKASRIVGGRASEWSAPSVPFLVDPNPPGVPAFANAAADGGVVTVTWGAAADSCSGVDHYAVERGSGTTWTRVASALTGNQLVDALPGAGAWRYRVWAVDGAGNPGPPAVSAEVLWLSEPDAGRDAGADAGSDAGVDDAGTDAGAPGTDVPAPRPLAVGCDCDSGAGPSSAVFLLVLLLGLRRRPR